MKTAFNRVLEHTQPVRTETRPDGVHEHRRLDMSDYGDIREATMDVVTLRPADGSEPVHTITGRHASFYNGLRYDEDTQAHKVVKRTVDGRTREYAGASMVLPGEDLRNGTSETGYVCPVIIKDAVKSQSVWQAIYRTWSQTMGPRFVIEDQASGDRINVEARFGEKPKTEAHFLTNWSLLLGTRAVPVEWNGRGPIIVTRPQDGKDPAHEVTVEPFMTIEDFATRSF